MSVERDLDRRKPQAANHVFEAHHPFDPTSDFLWAWRAHDDSGVSIHFCEDLGGADHIYIKRTMWLDADQCEQFGKALIASAEIIRKSQEDEGKLA